MVFFPLQQVIDHMRSWALIGSMLCGMNMTAAWADDDLPSATVDFNKELTVASHGELLPGMIPFDEFMNQFLAKHQVPGASVAVTYQGRLVLSKGYGFADSARTQLVSPETRFRIASVSKPLTAVAVLLLVQQGQLRLEDRVIDVLADQPYFRETAIVDPRWSEVTIDHLLSHRGGWDRDKSFDPMFRSIDFARQLEKQPPASATDVIQVMLAHPLDHAPGSQYAYSNFGYCLLGRVIEVKSGQSYENFVREQVLKPVGVENMNIGHTLPELREANESYYFDTGRGRSVFADSDVAGEAVRVDSPDGAWYLEAMDSHGGWIANSAALLRFQTKLSTILQPEWLEILYARPVEEKSTVEEGPASVYYSRGWQNRVVSNQQLNHWHSGSLPGTTSLLIDRHDGVGFAAILNTRQSTQTKNLAGELDRAVHQAAATVLEWPTADLFDGE